MACLFNIIFVVYGIIVFIYKVFVMVHQEPKSDLEVKEQKRFLRGKHRKIIESNY